MSRTPVRLAEDRSGRRWAVVSARQTRGCPSQTLRARFADLPGNPGQVLEELRVLMKPHEKPHGNSHSDPSAANPQAKTLGYFLRGDEHHQADYYDITEHLRQPERVAERLANRRVARIDAAPGPASWWSENLPQTAVRILEATGADALLLTADWTPPASRAALVGRREGGVRGGGKLFGMRRLAF